MCCLHRSIGKSLNVSVSLHRINVSSKIYPDVLILQLINFFFFFWQKKKTSTTKGDKRKHWIWRVKVMKRFFHRDK